LATDWPRAKTPRILSIVDTHSRSYPATDPRFTNRGEDVMQALGRVCSPTGNPMAIRMDHGSQFISNDHDRGPMPRMQHGTSHGPIARQAGGAPLQRGKSTGNGFNEAFNGRLRIEGLNRHWFLTLTDVRETFVDWCRHNIEDESHSAIG
jgi:putative transposase